MNCISVDQRDSKTVLRRERSLHEELIRFWRLNTSCFYRGFDKLVNLLSCCPAPQPCASQRHSQLLGQLHLQGKPNASSSSLAGFTGCWHLGGVSRAGTERGRRCPALWAGGISWHQLSFTSTITLIWQGWHIFEQLTCSPCHRWRDANIDF